MMFFIIATLENSCYRTYFCLVMKKLTTLFVLVIYMASAVGFTFSLHYCGGKFKEVCFTSDTEKNCCGSKEKSHGCCNDKVISAKFKDNHTGSFKTILTKVFSTASLLAHYNYPSEKKTREYYLTTVAKDTSPPFSGDVPIYIKIRVLRV